MESKEKWIITKILKKQWEYFQKLKEKKMKIQFLKIFNCFFLDLFFLERSIPKKSTQSCTGKCSSINGDGYHLTIAPPRCRNWEWKMKRVRYFDCSWFPKGNKHRYSLAVASTSAGSTSNDKLDILYGSWTGRDSSRSSGCTQSPRCWRK